VKNNKNIGNCSGKINIIDTKKERKELYKYVKLPKVAYL
jgi:hypothetical protein